MSIRDRLEREGVEMTRQTLRRGLRVFLALVALAIIAGGVVGWTNYRRIRDQYDAYRTLIQRGVKIAGVDVGWHTPEEARAKVEEWVAEPYYRGFAVSYQDETLALSPGDDPGEAAGVLVIRRQAVDVPVQGVEAGRRQDARLAHGAAEALLPAPGLLDEVARPRQHRAHRTPQPLAEIDPGAANANNRSP